MQLLYPTVMENLPTQISDRDDLETWRRKHLLTYLAPVIMNASIYKLPDHSRCHFRLGLIMKELL